MKKIFNFILSIIDDIKSFMYHWGLRILIVVFLLIILHNVLKILDILPGDLGNYRNPVSVYDEEGKSLMNIYSLGSGGRTIVILPGFGSQSPVLQYKAIAKKLSSSYRVVIVEYFGYGFSDAKVREKRTNDNISEEIVKALQKAGISGPYYLMPHSISKLYAIKMQQNHPGLVSGIIALDGIFPAEVNDDYYDDINRRTVTNVNLTSVFELTGFERILSYAKPSIFYIDKMQEMKDVYTGNDIKLYRNRIAVSYLTGPMVSEINKLIDNMTELKDYKYPTNLPVLEILSEDRIEEYKEAKANKGATVDLYELAEGMITNNENQEIVVIKGDHALEFTNPDGVASEVRRFLSSN